MKGLMEAATVGGKKLIGERGSLEPREVREVTAGMRDVREARARLLLGLLAADIYKDACAAEMFRGAISLMPDLVAAHVELGMVYCRLGKYGDAVRSFRQAIHLNPVAVRTAVRNEPEGLDQLRRVLYGEVSVVVPAEGEVRSSTPDYVRASWALVGLGREHVGTGRDDKAMAALEAALKLDETHPGAAAMLALTLMLMREGGRVIRGEGLLQKIKPRLARLILDS